MKITLILIAVLVSCTAYAKTLNVYYFHGKGRCSTCKNMESYSREAIETYFKKDIESGKINFKAINIDVKGNEHYVTDYKLYTKTLIVSITKNGKEVRYKNLDKIWEYARNKNKFIDYVKTEITKELK